VKTDGVNRSDIIAKKIAAFEIQHCSIEEQKEIVRILDDLFAKEQNAKDLCDLEALAGPGNGKNHAVNPCKYS